MNLPDLASQALYARLAWGAIAAVLAMRALHAAAPRVTWAQQPAIRRLIGALAAASMWLPGELSPAFWVGMVLHAPSVTLALLCLAWIVRTEVGGPEQSGPDARQSSAWDTLWPAAAAVTTAMAGLLLYAGVFVWLPYDFYSAGFRPFAGAAVAAAVALLWRALGAANGVAALCLGLAVLVHATTRWPTGNLWDAVLDPVLVALSIASAARLAFRSWKSRAGRPARHAARESH